MWLGDREENIRNYYQFNIPCQKSFEINVRMVVGIGAAILYYISENECNEDRHKFYPRSADSWCKFQAVKITGKDTYKGNFPSKSNKSSFDTNL